MSSKEDTGEGRKDKVSEEKLRETLRESLREIKDGESQIEIKSGDWPALRSRLLERHLHIPSSQNVIDQKGNRKVVTSPSSTEGDDSPRVPTVKLRHGPRDAVFYSVTESEIEDHAQLGFLSSIALTLFGTFAGFMLGCLVALIQGDMSEVSTTVFFYLVVVATVVAVIFFAAAAYLWRIRKQKSQVWKAPPEE